MKILEWRIADLENFDDSPIYQDGYIMYPIPKLMLLLNDGTEVVHPAFRNGIDKIYMSDEIPIEQLTVPMSVSPQNIVTVEQQDAYMRYVDLLNRSKFQDYKPKLITSIIKEDV